MPKGKVTIYYWYRDSSFKYIKASSQYSYYAIKLLIIQGLFHLSGGIILDKTTVEQITQQFASLAVPEVGHISLRTHRGGANNKGIYASFWPKQSDITVTGKQGTEGDFVAKLKIDRDREGGVIRDSTGIIINHKQPRNPDKTIELEGLDVDIINDAFLTFKTNPGNWSLFGSVISPLRKHRTKNCAGLTDFLLEKGGMYKNIQHSRLFNPYLRTTWRYSALTAATLNGAVIGAILYGKNEMLSYGLHAYILTYLFHILLYDRTSSDGQRHNVVNSLGSATIGAIVGGLLPCTIWGSTKGALLGFRIGKELSGDRLWAGILSSQIGHLFGVILSGLIGLIISLPTNLMIAALCSFISEGSGLALTPEGLCTMVEYTKQFELLQLENKPRKASEYFHSLLLYTPLLFASMYFYSLQMDNQIHISNPFNKLS